jgi:hypothetical protein
MRKLLVCQHVPHEILGTLNPMLKRAGYTHVLNMEGSIFKSANEGRQVYRDGRPVEKVHPCNETWGRLLDGTRRAELAPKPK